MSLKGEKWSAQTTPAAARSSWVKRTIRLKPLPIAAKARQGRAGQGRAGQEKVTCRSAVNPLSSTSLLTAPATAPTKDGRTDRHTWPSLGGSLAFKTFKSLS